MDSQFLFYLVGLTGFILISYAVMFVGETSDYYDREKNAGVLQERTRLESGATPSIWPEDACGIFCGVFLISWDVYSWKWLPCQSSN